MRVWKIMIACIACLMLCVGCCPEEEDDMQVHGRPFWGARVDFSAGAVAPPVNTYELNRELKVIDWTWIHADNAPGYVSPQLTFCGEPIPIGPVPFHSPVAPVRVYYSYTGNGSDWQLVDPADYMTSMPCGAEMSVLWPDPPLLISLFIFNFLQADTYLNLPTGTTYLMWTEQDSAFNARKGLSPKVVGVTPV